MFKVMSAIAIAGTAAILGKNFFPSNSKTETTSTNNFTIYELELENGKYYVGKTTKSAEARFEQHKTGIGSTWTKLHKPIKIIKSYKGDKYTEDISTLRLMELYGIDNVRGGSYVNIVLGARDKDHIRKLIGSFNDHCWKCGKSGHFAKNCSVGTENNNKNNKINNNKLMTNSSKIVVQRFRFKNQKGKKHCWRCGHTNHVDAFKCFAKIDINGKPL